MDQKLGPFPHTYILLARKRIQLYLACLGVTEIITLTEEIFGMYHLKQMDSFRNQWLKSDKSDAAAVQRRASPGDELG